MVPLRVRRDMAEIPLSRGLVAIVDDADAEWLMQWKWRAKWCQSRFYAARTQALPGGKRRTILMHREIMGNPVGLMVDHWDLDTLNNQRANLRACTNAQNQQNRKPAAVLKGAHRSGPAFHSSIRVNGRNIWLGRFATAEEAHAAYAQAAQEHFGDFARVA
jgi:hypothetical protein